MRGLHTLALLLEDEFALLVVVLVLAPSAVLTALSLVLGHGGIVGRTARSVEVSSFWRLDTEDKRSWRMRPWRGRPVVGWVGWW